MAPFRKIYNTNSKNCCMVKNAFKINMQKIKILLAIGIKIGAAKRGKNFFPTAPFLIRGLRH